MTDTVFHRIIAGDIPCNRVYEDDHVLAFLDIFPLSKGHTLVIPKVHAETLDQLDDVHAAAIGRALPVVSRAILAATGAKDFNILQNNGSAAHQAVFWVHFHIIPKIEGSGLAIDWRPGELDSVSAVKMAETISSYL